MPKRGNPTPKSKRSNDSDSLKDYYKYSLFVGDKRKKRAERRAILIAGVTLFYSLIAIIAVFFFLDSDRFSIIDKFTKDSSQQQQLSKFEKSLSLLSENMATFQEFLDQSSQINNTAVLITRLDQLESQQGAIAESILADPDKALTTRLLRDKQENVEEDLNEIKEAQIRLESQFDNFVLFVFLAPILTALVGFFFWFLRSKIFKGEHPEL